MKIIGHRGAKGLAPENTLASIKKAIEHQVDEIEFDIRVTKDGVVVLHHDETVKLNETELDIRKSTFSQLQAIDPKLTTLEEVLTFINSKQVLLIEIKAGEPTEPVVKLIANAIANGYKTETLLLGSFSQKSLRELHKALPDIQKVVIERWSGAKATWRANQLGTKRLNMRSWWLWVGFLKPMHKRGWQIAPYTMNDPQKAKKWAPYLFGVITDYPDRFQK